MAERKGKASRIAVWVILALLVVGLIGFGTDNFGGGARSVAAVGDREVTAEAFATAMQAEQRRIQQEAGQPVTMAELRGAGVDQAVLGQLMTQAAFGAEADAVGVSAGDAQVRDALVAEPAFQGPDGRFDPAAYRSALERSGLGEPEYEADLRDAAARRILLSAVAGGVEAPPAYTDAILSYAGEEREVTWAAFDAAALDEPVGDPAPEELAAWYEANGEAFTVPETRVVTYAWLRPEALLEQMEVTDEAVRALYDERIDEFVRPERRLVERLVFPTELEAQDAADRIAAGEAEFDALVEGRGLELADVDLGDVTRADLGEAGDGVFALAEPGVVGPLPTDLGPALFRVNAILSASETPFEDVRDELRREVALIAARRAAADMAVELDDLLAGGATLEELAADTPAELGTVRLQPGDEEGIAAYAAFRDAAAAASEGDFPELLTLDDDGLAALRLDEVVPPRVPPLDEVREAAVEAWRADRTRERLAERAEALGASFAEGGDIAGPGITVAQAQNLRRTGTVDGAPEGFVETAFETGPGAAAVVAGRPVALLRVDAVSPPDADAPGNEIGAELLRAQVAQGMAQDLLTAYVRSIQSEAGIERDQAAIEGVLAQFQ